jgi:uncharacterized membrane protein YhaH (DUF805 family)
MTLSWAIQSGFSKYVIWQGRASRSEFWFWILFIFVGNIVAGFIDQILGITVYSVDSLPGASGFDVSFAQVGILSTLWVLGTFLPTIAVTVRRLHDTNHSGWWWWLQLLNILCFIGTIILIFAFWIRPSDPTNNNYGLPPRR